MIVTNMIKHKDISPHCIVLDVTDSKGDVIQVLGITDPLTSTIFIAYCENDSIIDEICVASNEFIEMIIAIGSNHDQVGFGNLFLIDYEHITNFYHIAHVHINEARGQGKLIDNFMGIFRGFYYF